MQQNNNDKKPGLSWSTPATPTANNKQQTPSTLLSLPKTNATNSNAMARYAGIFVGGLIVGVVLAWGWTLSTNKGSTVATNSTSTIATTNGTSTTSKTARVTKQTTPINTSVAGGVVLQNAELSLASTQSAGQSVTIDTVTVSKPTWVVVYDNNNGTPGNVLGAQLFFTTSGGTVTLLRPTVAGKTYFVGRAVDNGDRKFQKNTDKAVLDESGNPVLATFTAK